jgi:hypothetical protein
MRADETGHLAWGYTPQRVTGAYMRSALRIAGRIGLWTLTGILGFVVVILAAVALTDDRSDSRLGAVILLVPALAALAGCIFGLRRTAPRSTWASTAATSRRSARASGTRSRAG